jgi:hypothetical protein
MISLEIQLFSFGGAVLGRCIDKYLDGNHPAAFALQEIRDTLRPNVPDIQGITDQHLPGIVRRILEEARKAGADPADFSGAVRRALEQARVHIANLEFATAAHVLDAQLAQIDAENRDRAREHAALLAERGRVAALQLRYLDATFGLRLEETLVGYLIMCWCSFRFSPSASSATRSAKGRLERMFFVDRASSIDGAK